MKPVHILIVDDEPDIRQSLSGVLEDEGYTAHAVESGEACLDALGGNPANWCCWISGCRAWTAWKR